MIELKNVSKLYGDKLALDDVSFTVNDGEVLGFLGPNGAGKSTTMNIITGYLSATSGQVLIDGTDILEEPVQAKRHIGYLPEIPPLYTDMTVTEYLEFIFDLKKAGGNRRARLEAVCAETGLIEARGRVIKNLSKGFRQRVGLAGALAADPDVLVLDEPTVGLDPQQIIEIRTLIKELGKKRTIVLSSHILPEVEAVCERVLVINKGRLVAEDTPKNLSRALSKDADVRIRAAGDEQTVIKLLRSIESVASAESLGEQESGTRDYCVKPKDGADVRAAAVKKLVENDIAVLAVKGAEMTLESIFLELIAREEK